MMRDDWRYPDSDAARREEDAAATATAVAFVAFVIGMAAGAALLAMMLGGP